MPGKSHTLFINEKPQWHIIITCKTDVLETIIVQIRDMKLSQLAIVSIRKSEFAVSKTAVLSLQQQFVDMGIANTITHGVSIQNVGTAIIVEICHSCLVHC